MSTSWPRYTSTAGIHRLLRRLAGTGSATRTLPPLRPPSSLLATKTASARSTTSTCPTPATRDTPKVTPRWSPHGSSVSGLMPTTTVRVLDRRLATSAKPFAAHLGRLPRDHFDPGAGPRAAAAAPERRRRRVGPDQTRAIAGHPRGARNLSYVHSVQHAERPTRAHADDSVSRECRYTSLVARRGGVTRLQRDAADGTAPTAT